MDAVCRCFGESKGSLKVDASFESPGDCGMRSGRLGLLDRARVIATSPREVPTANDFAFRGGSDGAGWEEEVSLNGPSQDRVLPGDTGIFLG